MGYFDQYDPAEIRNVINGILRRLGAVEQGFVVVNNITEIVPGEETSETTSILPLRVLDENGVLRLIISSDNLLDEFGVDAYAAVLSADGMTPVVWVDATTDELHFSGGTGIGDVISDSTSSTLYNIPLFSSTDGKHIEDYAVGLPQVTLPHSVFWASGSPSAISGVKKLEEKFANVVDGSTTIYLADEASGFIDKFVTLPINVPALLGGLATAEIWISADVEQQIYLLLETWIVTNSGDNVGGASVGKTINITNTPQKIIFDITNWGGTTFAVQTDYRLEVKIFVDLAGAVGSNITLHYGESTPIIFKLPYVETETNGTGDMSASVYDPDGVEDDVFDRNNHNAKTGLADGEYSGESEPGTAGEAYLFGTAIFLDTDNKWKIMDCSTMATCSGKAGICVLAASGDGQPTRALTWGNVRADAVIPVMTTGVIMYAGGSGVIDPNPPSSFAGEIIRPLGYANSANELHFEPAIYYFEIG
jgi:hypothetical protein